MVNKLRTLLLLFACVVNWVANAQTIRMEDVLGTVQQDPMVSRYQSIRDIANDIKMHDPLLKEISLRIGFNGSVLGDTIYGYLRNEDDLRLQVSFNAFGVRKQQKQVKSARLQTITAGQAVLSHSALVERYEVLSAYLYTLPELDALRQLDSLLQTEHEIIKAMLSTGILEIKVTRILDVEEDRNQILLDISEAEERLRRAKLDIEKFVGSFSAIETDQLASVEELKTSFTVIKATGFLPHPDHLALSAEVQLDSVTLNYAAGQNKQILDYVSLGYQNPLYLDRPNRFNTFNNFAFRLGLLVPLTANNRYRKADALLDFQESQLKEDEARIDREISWQRQMAILEGLFREYELAEDRLANSLISQMLSNQVLLAHITPLEFVELKIAQQKLVLHQVELAMEIAEAYVEFLDLSGFLAWHPDTNYLTSQSY